MSRAEVRARRAAENARQGRDRSHASARLGLTLRSVLIAPRDGFRAALSIADRRARAGLRPAEGVAPTVLSALGGAALGLLWLKVGALMGMRDVCSATYLTGYIAATVVLGGLLGLAAQSLWGLVGPRSLVALRGERPDRHDIRLVWGASLFPQVLALFLLLPLDLLVVGRDSFTTAELTDPLSTAWAAFSIALGVSAVVWTLFLLVRGIQASTGLTGSRAVVGAAGALFSLAVVVGAFVALTLLVPQGGGCPTQLG